MLLKLSKPFTISVALLVLFLMAACQAPEPSEQDRAGQDLAGVQGPVSGSAASRIEDYVMPPASIQELVNRSHAVVVGTVSAISGPVMELPYFTTEADFADWPAEQWPYIEVVYYDIAIEEVLLDDGNVRENARLRLGDEWSVLPKLGKRYLFTLGVNPDYLSYGISAHWEVLTMDVGTIRNLDGTPSGYVGVVDETSLLDNVRTAARNYDFMPYSEWPGRFFTGGTDDGEPVGKTGRGGS